MNIQRRGWVLASAILSVCLYSMAEAITVDTTNDADNGGDGLCSLREAITAVNNGATYNECTFTAAPETINFNVNGTITLLSALPQLDGAVTITGPGAANLTVSGGSFNVFNLPSAFPSRRVTISDLTIKNAWRAITVGRNNTLTLNDCAVTGNDGPGVLIYGALTMNRTLVDANTGGGLNFGCGSFGHITDSMITNNTLTDNNGAGISSCGEIDVVNTVISDNTTNWWGGGIEAGGILRLVGSTVSGNGDGLGAAGILVQGGTAITNSTVSSNLGVGIRVSAGDNAILDIYSSTITGNQDAGLHNDKIATAENTVFAGNTGDNCAGSQAVQSFGYNIDDSIGDCGFNNMGDQVDVDPLLGPLEDNGGLTFTHALLTGSPAIDAGDPNGCADQHGTTLDADQRGEKRPIDGDGDGAAVCDIGAYEWASALADLFGGGGGGGGLCSLGPKSASAWMAGDLWLLLAFISGLGLWGTRRRKDAIK